MADIKPFKDKIRSDWARAFEQLNRDKPGISGLMSLTEAWNTAREYLRPTDSHHSRERTFDARVKESFDFLEQSSMIPRLAEAYAQDVRKQSYLISEEIVDWMHKYELSNDIEMFSQLIMQLVTWWRVWSPVPEVISLAGGILFITFRSTFHTLLCSILPPSFPGAFKRLCGSIIDKPPDSSIWQSLNLLGLLDHYENLVASVYYERIEVEVHEVCPGNWGEQMLPRLRAWMSDSVVPWMIPAYARNSRNEEELRMMLIGVGSRFDFHLCKVLCDLRTTEIFDIMVDYPDSNPALLDLKECLQRVGQRGDLVASLRRSNRKRLLHQGADTKDILTQYVSMMRCLRIIDPPGVLLFKVADPVRRYLRERPDTIRSIVASLVGQSGDLIDENEPLQPLQLQYEDDNDPQWQPESMDASPEFRTNKPSDVISTLVSIYDSKDLFIKELQVLLAQRLLAITDGNYEKERRNIEILKVRFGEAPLQVCEVMLKDMTDSRRINQHVHSQNSNAELCLHPIIVSKNFWPALESSKLKMPGQFNDAMNAYTKEFSAFKPDKKLRWLPELGTVDLSVELSDRVVEVTVTPLQAAIIEVFSDVDTWKLTALSEKINVDASAIRKAIDIWIEHGVLCEDESGSYILLEKAGTIPSSSSRVNVPLQAVIEDAVPAVMTAQQQEAEQMRVYWKFIEGMLTNLGALPLDRIQTMLKFAPNYTRTVSQLGSFMEAARREGLVVVNNGLWKLNK